MLKVKHVLILATLYIIGMAVADDTGNLLRRRGLATSSSSSCNCVCEYLDYHPDTGEEIERKGVGLILSDQEMIEMNYGKIMYCVHLASYAQHLIRTGQAKCDTICQGDVESTDEEEEETQYSESQMDIINSLGGGFKPIGSP